MAVSPSMEIRAAANVLARRVCETIPGAKIVSAGNMHLTLSFLGEVDDGEINALIAGLAGAVTGIAPFIVGFSGLGAFPSAGKASVLWAGVGEGKPGLRALAGRVQSVTRENRRKNGEKPFVPHLTLARFRAPASLARLEVFPELMQTDLGMCTIGNITLMRSRLGPEGPVYEELCTCGMKA